MELNIVSLEDSHEVEGRHSLLLVPLNRVLHVLESASSCEGLVLVVNLCILVVDLHLMEALIAHAFGMHDEATLSERVVIVHVIEG